MKLHLSSWLIGAASVASAASSGRVLLLESPTQISSKADVVSPKTARLIFAQRLGLSDQFSISEADDEGIQQVDRYGGPQQHPLSGSSPVGLRLITVVNGVEDTGLFIPKSLEPSSFDVVPAPHPKDIDGLVAELAGLLNKEAPSYKLPQIATELAKHHGNTLEVLGNRIILQISSLSLLSKSYGNNSPQVYQELSQIRELIDEVRESDDFVTATFVFMPPEHLCNKQMGAKNAFGTVEKRDAAIRPIEVPLAAEQAQSKVSVSSKVAAEPPKPLAKVKGSIPSRFSSIDACERVTGNCTGHGACKLIAREPVDDRVTEIFGCVCEKQVVKSASGTLTTYFAGAACQKKDISASFWLLAGTVTFLVTILSLALGLLYSMGSEELPSVIGAGVSGPRAK